MRERDEEYHAIACGARVTWEVVKRAGVKYVILGDTRGWALGAEEEVQIQMSPKADFQVSTVVTKSF